MSTSCAAADNLREMLLFPCWISGPYASLPGATGDKCDCAQQADESGMAALWTVVPLGRSGLCRETGPWVGSWSRKWGHEVLVPSERQERLLGAGVTCCLRESPGDFLLMVVFSVNALRKLFKSCDNMANKEKGNCSLEWRKVQELFVCPWAHLEMKEDAKSLSPCFSSAPSWSILAFGHPEEVGKVSLTESEAEEEKQHEFVEGFAYSHLLIKCRLLLWHVDEGSERDKSIFGLLKSIFSLLKRKLECNG